MKWDIGVFFLEYLNSWIDVKDPFFCNQMPKKSAGWGHSGTALTYSLMHSLYLWSQHQQNY